MSGTLSIGGEGDSSSLLGVAPDALFVEDEDDVSPLVSVSDGGGGDSCSSSGAGVTVVIWGEGGVEEEAGSSVPEVPGIRIQFFKDSHASR
ncbi:MAG: hypothetical protein A3F09_00370 [Chlamydiae bacterium RIFCSPHIGHO2_12_FULL_49_11]|nr:MAG: hypothetical protein A3F09_00370 [Chlamydiae bacterium RIFCSPHIGHO2_12_FULL_49_11]